VRCIVPLIALLLLVPGCGGGGGEPGRTATTKSGETLAVVADEYSFDPENIVLTGGDQLTVALENEGVLAHNLRVIRNGEDIGGTPTFTGGNTREGTVTVEPGEYELVCTVGNHAELGMKGKLTVK
jgi:plastocyanin